MRSNNLSIIILGEKTDLIYMNLNTSRVTR